MNDAELDRAYTALCEMLARIGESRTALALAMICLSLISRQGSIGDVLGLIDKAEAASRE